MAKARHFKGNLTQNKRLFKKESSVQKAMKEDTSAENISIREDHGSIKRDSPVKCVKDDIQDTIFIRNLSFDIEEPRLKEFIEENFGPTVYCLVCKVKETDDSKGTAFAKFKDPEDASKCLREFKDGELQTKFHFGGRNLIVLPAISRDKIHEVSHKEDKSKDKRNLALSKEGRIHPESDEGKEMSKTDLEKRKVLDTRKRELLKNLHNFVSDTRLCIHNLPASVDDSRLRAIFRSVQDEFTGAKITECRVMRNKKGSGKLSTSKGFGFVAFSKHEHALAALRNLNNNANVFGKDRRPIVEFSIENLVALNKKKTRLVNSQRKNEKIRMQGTKPETSNKKPNQLERGEKFGTHKKKTKQPDNSQKKNKLKKLHSKKMKKKSTVNL